MKQIIIMLLLIVTSSAFAGFNGLTIHSRANCYNNESISWDWTHDWNFATVSAHTFKSQDGTSTLHVIRLPYEKTWRSAAVHWNEGTSGGWEVSGGHMLKDDDGKETILGTETVTDCSIYDGWWDKEKEKQKDKERFYD